MKRQYLVTAEAGACLLNERHGVWSLRRPVRPLHIMLYITDISGFDRSDHPLAHSLSVLSLSLAARVR